MLLCCMQRSCILLLCIRLNRSMHAYIFYFLWPNESVTQSIQPIKSVVFKGYFIELFFLDSAYCKRLFDSLLGVMVRTILLRLFGSIQVLLFLFLFLSGVFINKLFLYQLLALNIMSLFLQGYEQINNLNVVLNQISKIMILQFRAELLNIQNRLIYNTKMMVSQKKLDLCWKFQPFKSSYVKVSVIPNLYNHNGVNFKVESHRSITDLLKIIHKCNLDKSKSMSFFMTENRSIQMCANFQLTQNLTQIHLRKLIHNIQSKLPESISKLMIKLQPFLELGGTANQQKRLSQTAQRFLNCSYGYILLSKTNQIKNKKLQQDKQSDVNQEEIEAQLDQKRIEAYKRIKESFTLLGHGQTFLQDKKDAKISLYSQWLTQQKNESTKSVGKNVLAITVLEEVKKTFEHQGLGSHCKISLSQCKVKVEISINPGLEEPNRKQQLTTATEISEQRFRKVKIIKKTVKDKEKIQSINSFKNQLDFIQYIRQRRCEYVSTFYWIYLMKKEQTQAVLVNYYPQNLRQLLLRQGKNFSFAFKLDLLHKIVKSISWIASEYICHRDIKPQNIMIDQNINPKLIDFGSCCPANGLGTLYFKVKQLRLLGTPNYYCPYDYQKTNHPYKQHQYEQHILFDVYSLGKVMRDIFEDCLPNLLPNLQGFMNYIIERCEQQDPINRLTCQQIDYFLQKVQKYLKELEKDA